MSKDLPSLSSHLLFRYFCTAWIATADISTLREGRCYFVPSQGSIQRGSDKVHHPCFDCTVAKALGWDSALFPASSATRCSAWFWASRSVSPHFHPHFSRVIIVSGVSPPFNVCILTQPLRQGRAVISAYREGSWRASAGQGNSIPCSSQKPVATSQTSALWDEVPPPHRAHISV